MLKQLAISIIEQLEANGFEAYFVGGCVRDWILNRPVHDIDICTNAHPGEVSNIFPDHIPTGLKHGTVSVKMGGYIFEVTTYRTEGKYTDFRRPDEVIFVQDLEEDLARRDFTINAMAMDRRGNLKDPFQGKVDLENGIIRAVGNPYTRFQEDALRLLRASRFAAQLGFAIEEKTKLAMKETAPYLAHIAIERIRDELYKLIDSDHPEHGCSIIAETSLLQVFPRLADLFHTIQPHAWRLTHLGSLSQKWAFILYAGHADEDEVNQICIQLRMSKKERQTIEQFVRFLRQINPRLDQPQEISWGPFLVEYGWEPCMQLDNILQAYWWKNRDRKSSQDLIEAYQRMPIRSLNELAISGLELQQALNRKAGEWIRLTLRSLLKQVALYGLPNTKEALIAVARKEVEQNEDQTRDSKGVS